jgi:hypothetical protein
MTYRLSIFTLLLLLLTACGDSEKYAPESYGAREAAPEGSYDFAGEEVQSIQVSLNDADGTTSAPTPSAPKVQRAAPKMVYTSKVRGRVVDLDSALVRVTRLVTKAGGYLSSQHRQNTTYEHTANLKIRLPADQLTATLEYLPALLEEIDYQNLDGRDVTAEWLDLESRLQTKRDVRDRYIDILRNRAEKVEDILNAEDKIRVITEEIEAKEGRLRYLRDQVSLSTLDLELYETQEYRASGPVTTRSFWSRLASSFSNGWDLVQSLVLGLLSIWPLLLIGGGGFWVVRRWWKNR